MGYSYITIVLMVPVSQEILSPGNSVAATIFPRKFCRGDNISEEILSLYFNAATAFPRKFSRTFASRHFAAKYGRV